MEPQKEKTFELAKPMNMVQMNWSKGMTPMQIKTIHVMTIKLKKWIMDTKFKPDPEQAGLDAYLGIRTYFEMPLDEFANMMQTSKRALKTAIKDDKGNTVMHKNFPKLRIMEYFEEVQKVKCTVNSQYIVGSFTPVAAAIYNKKTDVVRLETTHSMAVVLQDEAFAKNLSFVDMQLQLSLNSVMASHILDRISRFKGVDTDYKCTVGDLITQCGIDEATMSNRNDFIKVNISRPLKQIEDKSCGAWERIGSGAKVTAKKRGTLLKEDEIVFKMKYNASKALDEPEDADQVAANGLVEAVELINLALKGDAEAKANTDFRLEVIGQVLGMAQGANSGDPTMVRTFKLANLNPVEVMASCGQAMALVIGI